MAEVVNIDDYETRGMNKYSMFTPYADGQAWKVHLDEDLKCNAGTESFRRLAYGYAMRHGKKASVFKVSDRVFVIQFRDRQQPAVTSKDKR